MFDLLRVLLGSAFIAYGAGSLQPVVRLVQTGLRTTGVIVATERHYVGRGYYEYYPAVRFVAQGGQTYVVRSAVDVDRPEFRQGETVTLYYDSRHPQTALVLSDRLWRSPLEDILIGTVIALFSAWPLLRRLRRRTPTHTRTRPIRPRRKAPARRQRHAPARRQR